MNQADDRAAQDMHEAASTRAYGGLSSEERRQQRRERLIEAGLDVFGRRGLSQSTMRDICTHARLSDRYFYESFANVQDVFEAVYVFLRGQLLERLHASMSGLASTQLSVAEAGLRTFFSFVREDPRRARIMLIDVLGQRYSRLGDRTQGHGAYQVQPYVDMFGDFFRAMYPGVDQLDIDVELVHQTMIGMTVQSAAAWADQGFDKSVDDMVRHNLFAWEGLDAWVQRLMAQHDERLRKGGLGVMDKRAASGRARQASGGGAAGKARAA